MAQIQPVGSDNLSNREDWLRKTLQAVPAGNRILDAGAGELQYKRFCTHLDYVGQDFAQYDGSGNNVGKQTGTWDQSSIDIISDIREIPEPDESFDAIMCIEVLEHVPHPVDALRELSRLLRPGGTLIITAPFCSLTHFAPYFYQTGYSSNFYEYWLEKMGFRIVDMQWNGNYFEFLGQELRRVPSVGRKYTCERINWFERQAVRVILHLLDRFSQTDQGSEQLLCYGLHVAARKR